MIPFCCQVPSRALRRRSVVRRRRSSADDPPPQDGHGQADGDPVGRQPGVVGLGGLRQRTAARSTPGTCVNASRRCQRPSSPRRKTRRWTARPPHSIPRAAGQDGTGRDVGDPGAGKAVKPHVARHVQGAHQCETECNCPQSPRPAAEPEVDGHQGQDKPDEHHPVQGVGRYEGRLPHHVDPFAAPVGGEQAGHVNSGENDAGHQCDRSGSF